MGARCWRKIVREVGTSQCTTGAQVIAEFGTICVPITSHICLDLSQEEDQKSCEKVEMRFLETNASELCGEGLVRSLHLRNSWRRPQSWCCPGKASGRLHDHGSHQSR